MVTAIFIQKYKEALGRIRTDLSDTNIRGCLNNSIDLTRWSDFVGFDEGILIGEILEGIFDNFEDMIDLFEHKLEEIEPIEKELMARAHDQFVNGRGDSCIPQVFRGRPFLNCIHHLFEDFNMFENGKAYVNEQ
jgi:hypothetical protein